MGAPNERRRLRVLVVSWFAGGGVMPMFGLARLLVRGGHHVRVLAPDAHRSRVEATGAEFRSSGLEFDPTRGRALEDQEEFVLAAVTGPAMARAVLDESSREPADLIVVDHFLRNAASAAEVLGVPTAAVVHTAYAYHGGGVGDPDDPRNTGPGGTPWDLGPVNETRAMIGAAPIRSTRDRPIVELYSRCAVALVPMIREFDPRPAAPANVRYVGPIFEEDAGATWMSPWPAPDDRPLVVVSLSSQYMHQEALLGRIVSALDDGSLRVLVTTGLELDPEEIEPSEQVAVVRYVPHRAVLPATAAVITHGGMGTIMSAFHAGVPAVCIPLGRDQVVNSSRVEALGAGVACGPDATAAEIRSAVDRVLADPRVRSASRRMAALAAEHGDGAEAVRVLERAGEAGLRRRKGSPAAPSR